jgi:PTH1 family peptidyl-tRNA hydrolase
VVTEKRVIVGLGNPGKEYEYTRHNLGFLVLVHIAKKAGLKFSKSSFTNGFLTAGDFDGVRGELLIPTTFMNNSGVAVSQMVKNQKLAHENILVVCDDMSLPFAQMRLRPDGSHGGHNGLRSIIDHLGEKNFPRLRLGIGVPPSKYTQKGDDSQHQLNVDYVLGAFNKEERKELDGFIEEAAECCLMWLREGITMAMERYNRKKSYGKE